MAESGVALAVMLPIVCTLLYCSVLLVCSLVLVVDARQHSPVLPLACTEDQQWLAFYERASD